MSNNDKDAKRSVGEPNSRMTRLCNAGLQAIETHPEYTEDVKIIIMIHDNTGGEDSGGIGMGGYNSPEDDSEAVMDLFIHLKSIFQANGSDLMIMPIHKG